MGAGQRRQGVAPGGRLWKHTDGAARDPEQRDTGRHVVEDHGVEADGGVVADVDLADDSGPGQNPDVVAEGGAVGVVGVADDDVATDPAVGTDAVGGDKGVFAVLDEEPWADVGSFDLEAIEPRAHPAKGQRGFVGAEIEEVAEFRQEGHERQEQGDARGGAARLFQVENFSPVVNVILNDLPVAGDQHEAYVRQEARRADHNTEALAGAVHGNWSTNLVCRNNPLQLDLEEGKGRGGCSKIAVFR